ncbi:MAG: hypothetical protein H6919_13980 [Sphingomonadaceae bacterium]|nr:hypothetical protein [Sphingomonadaceae bacterium]
MFFRKGVDTPDTVAAMRTLCRALAHGRWVLCIGLRHRKSSKYNYMMAKSRAGCVTFVVQHGQSGTIATADFDRLASSDRHRRKLQQEGALALAIASRVGKSNRQQTRTGLLLTAKARRQFPDYVTVSL